MVPLDVDEIDVEPVVSPVVVPTVPASGPTEIVVAPQTDVDVVVAPGEGEGDDTADLVVSPLFGSPLEQGF